VPDTAAFECTVAAGGDEGDTVIMFSSHSRGTQEARDQCMVASPPGVRKLTLVG
jgi:hypothetical protein